MAISYALNPFTGGFDAISSVTIGTANGLSITSAQVLSLTLSSTSTTGALSSTDWNTFNGKQPAGTYIKADGTIPFAAAESMGNFNLTNVADPVGAQDAATKSYVDTAIAALQPAAACYAASTANIAGTYLNGVAGVGATFTTAATGTFTIDGVTPALGARILIKDQSSGFQNGVYNITTLGALGVSTVFTRALDYNTASDMNSAGLLPVINGTVNALTSWQQVAVITTVGSDSLVFTEFTANPSLYLLKANNLNDVANATTSFKNISPLTTEGDLLYYTSSNNARLAIGGSNRVLTSNGTDPAWALLTNSNLSGSAAITNANLASMSTLTIKGNNTGGSATPSDLTVAQVNAILPVFTSTLNGLAPLSGGGSSNFLRADGTWAVAAITQLTGDVTAGPGTGSVAATLATVNSNVGSFGSASSVSAITVNAKGLVTAAASTSIQIAESQVTNLVSDLAGKQATGNYITALTGDATAAGPGSAALTLATVNSNVGSFGSATATGTFTVNAKGLITAASATAIQITESQVTNLTTDLAAKVSTTLTSAHILVGNVSNVATDVAVTGDVTISNAGVTAIGANKVANSQLATIATATFKGRTTAGTGNVEDLTATQATALLNNMVGDSGSGGTKGLVPAPAAGDAAAGKFLKADGTFAVPSGGGSSATAGYWNGYYATGASDYWSLTSSTFATYSDTGAHTLTQISNLNFGTVVAQAAKHPGITFTAPHTGVIEVTCVASVVVNASTNNRSTNWRLIEEGGTTVIDICGMYAGSNASNYQDQIILKGYFSATATTSYTFSIQAKTSGDTTYIGGAGAEDAGLSFKMLYVT